LQNIFDCLLLKVWLSRIFETLEKFIELIKKAKFICFSNFALYT